MVPIMVRTPLNHRQTIYYHHFSSLIHFQLMASLFFSSPDFDDLGIHSHFQKSYEIQNTDTGCTRRRLTDSGNTQ